MRTRRVLAALTGVAGIVAGVLAQTSARDAVSLGAVGLMYGAYIAVGLVILDAHPGHLVGRLMFVGGCISGAGSGLLEVAWRRLQDHPDDRLFQLTATLGSTGRGLGWVLGVLVLPLVFPDGRRAGPRWVARPAWYLACAAVVMDVCASLFAPTQSDLRMVSVRNPIGLPRGTSGFFGAVDGLFLMAALVTLGLAAACLFWRWRHADSLDRQRLLWFALAFVLPVVALGLSFGDLGRPWVFALVSLPLPVAIGVACLQHRLYDVNLAVNRSLTYSALWVVIAALYALTVGGVGAMMRQEGAGWLPWVAAGVVAVSFAPLRDAMQRGANRLTYGQWSQPAEVLATAGRRLSDAADVPALLQGLADELSGSLHLSYVQIEDVEGTSLARHGQPAADAERVELHAYGECVGAVLWSGRDLREADRVLIDDVARQLGGIVHAAAMFRAVRASQERLVLAREEERKRLRRDLHDGLGPALAGLTLQVDTLRHQLDASADGPLLGLRSGIQSTVLDVRRIVEGLRPPALDELGLAEALNQLAHRLEPPVGPVVTVEVVSDGRLPAAVEVAAYRIVAEAVNNAIRHAGATGVRVCLTETPGCLAVCVSDDGVGDVAPREGGVGLSSMRERAEEIGGTFAVVGEPGGGTRVHAELPLASRVLR